MDSRQALISQYANSPTIVQMLENFSNWSDVESLFGSPESLQSFFGVIWDIDHAIGFGLEIWGRILGASRNIPVLSQLTYFGFSEGSGAPFGSAAFYNGPSSGNIYRLADDAYRTLLLVKAAANICSTNADTLNSLLRSLFPGGGRCYVSDLGSMRMRYLFEFPLLPYEISVVSAKNILPRPAGVEAFLAMFNPTTTFGFAEGSGQPFGVGTFLAPGDSYAIL